MDRLQGTGNFELILLQTLTTKSSTLIHRFYPSIGLIEAKVEVKVQKKVENIAQPN
jgi:hypothetical protein